MLSKAISIASEAFIDKVDRGGKPYILHCLAVMNSVDQSDPELMQIAVLHDLLEDCEEWTSEKLILEGFSVLVVCALILLNHRKDQESYDEYIKGISGNKDAVKVKLADLKHNSDITRIKGLRKKDFDRIEKYHRAYVYLS